MNNIIIIEGVIFNKKILKRPTPKKADKEIDAKEISKKDISKDSKIGDKRKI